MKFDKKVLISIMLGIIISIMTNVIAESFEKDSKNVYYKDNSGLLADNVQDAIDGTCTKFESKVDNFLDKIYPVGSIYITTTLSTTAQVKEALGGEWAVYGDGRTLLSSSGKSEQIGGANTVTLVTDNLPSHTHSFTPAGSVASTFKGTAVTSGTQSANHTHTFSGTSSTTGNHSHTFSGTTSSNGAHTHTAYNKLQGGSGYTITNSNFWYSSTIGWQSGSASGRQEQGASFMSSAGAHTHTYSGTTSTTGNHSHTYSGTTSANSANHTHSVTAAGTVTSTFTGTASNTGATGGGKSFSVQDAYITVYMYKRTA